MKPRNRSDNGPNVPPPDGAITAANYTERAIAFMKRSGRHSGEHPVVRSVEGQCGSAETGKPATPEQWRAWIAYLERLGVPTVAARKLGVMTVPAYWPWEFDRTAPEEIPDEPWQPERRKVWTGKLLAPVLNANSFEAAVAKPKRHPWLQSRIEAQQPKPIDHSAPVSLSPEASSRFTRMQEAGE